MLHSNWFTEKRIDFEYQSYRLLAYLKTVNESFKKVKLYPFLPELINHRENLLQLKNKKLGLAEKFPKELSKFDLKNLSMEYKFLLRDDALMEEINSIVDFSLPKIDHYIGEGNSIFSFVKDKINVYPVGIVPIYTKEGYILVPVFSKGGKSASVYYYCFSLYINEISKDSAEGIPLPAHEIPEELFCNIKTKFVSSVQLSVSNTLENIKTQLIKNNPQLPNPATFAVESEFSFPVDETVLPIAKKLLLNYFVSPPGNPGAIA